MPSRPPRRCLTCRNLFVGARCPVCDRSWQRSSEAWSSGSTRRWRKVRRVQLQAFPYCATCGALASEVDHLDGTDYSTQRYDPAMLRSLCTPCHRARTSAQGHAAQGHAQTI